MMNKDTEFRLRLIILKMSIDDLVKIKQFVEYELNQRVVK